MTGPLITRLAVSLVALLQTAAGQPPATPPVASDPSAIVLTVRLGNPQGEIATSIPVVAITHDARIRIVAEVVRVEAGTSPWPEGSKVAFLIHSPALTFGGYDFPGKTYRFTLKPVDAGDPWGLAWVLAEVEEQRASRARPGAQHAVSADVRVVLRPPMPPLSSISVGPQTRVA